MFEDSLLESGGSNSKIQRRSPWTTVLSFLLQSALVGLLVLLPLIYTDTLPKQQLMTYLVAPPPPPPPPPPAAPAAPVMKAVPKPVSQLTDTGQLKAPTKIPEKVAVVKEEPPPSVPSTAEGVVGGVPGGIPGGTLGGVPGGVPAAVPDIHPAAAPPPPPPPPATPQRVKISAGITAGMRELMINPVYPPLAKAARISGAVVLQAVIGKDGTIQRLRAISGHPMLIQSAIEAVSKWRYKPYFLNGEPVEVDTQVTVNFVLQGG